MRLYAKFISVFCLLLTACSKEGVSESPITTEENVEVNYSILQTSDDILSEVNIIADRENILASNRSQAFESIAMPLLTNFSLDEALFYNNTSDCSGELLNYDLDKDTSKEFSFFEDSKNCDRQIYAIKTADIGFFILYSLPGDFLKDEKFYLRLVDNKDLESGFEDFEMDKKPTQLVYANGRLFVLVEDLALGNVYSMQVFDLQKKEWILEINLGDEVERLIRTPDNNLMITYPDLHNVYSTITLDVLSSTRYLEGTEPHLGETEIHHFAPDGKVYFASATNLNGTIYPQIPAVFDFERNTTILYYYENFLTEEEQRFEFDIGNTTAVAYDSKNNLMLIGYQKSQNPNKGGLIRIKPAPNPKMVDQTNLEGIPLYIYSE